MRTEKLIQHQNKYFKPELQNNYFKLLYNFVVTRFQQYLSAILNHG